MIDLLVFYGAQVKVVSTVGGQMYLIVYAQTNSYGVKNSSLKLIKHYNVDEFWHLMGRPRDLTYPEAEEGIRLVHE